MWKSPKLLKKHCVNDDLRHGPPLRFQNLLPGPHDFAHILPVDPKCAASTVTLWGISPGDVLQDHAAVLVARVHRIPKVNWWIVNIELIKTYKSV
jgi:hypothetical protein